MWLEEVEKLSKKQLRALINRSFELAEEPGRDRGPLYEKAAFYMRELEHRRDSGVSIRDFLLEIVVIALIGWEIGLAIKQGKDEDKLMDKQNAILTNLQASTSDTAATMKGLAELTKSMGDNTSASAKTLLSLRSTTREMNKGVQYQISLFYDPSIVLIYDATQNRLLFQNMGRTGHTLNDVYINGVKASLGGPKLIAGGTLQYIEVAELYKTIAGQLAKGEIRTLPVEAHLQNELSKKYVMSSSLLFVTEGDKVVVHTSTSSVRPEPGS